MNETNSFYASSILLASELLLKLPRVFLNNNNIGAVDVNKNQKIYKESFLFSDEDDDEDYDDEEISNLYSTLSTSITPIVVKPLQSYAAIVNFTTQINCDKFSYINKTS